MKIKKWIFDGHPQRYHIAALALALLAVSMAFVTTILAEESGLTTTINTATTTTETATPEQCEYDYSSWSSCQSNGTRTRSIKEVSPSGCSPIVAPILTESCTYSSGTTTKTTTTTETATPEQCVYDYSSWSSCQSNGTRVRTLRSKSPNGCQEYIHPVLKQSCVYDSTAVATSPVATTADTTTHLRETTETSVEAVTNVTPLFSFINVNDRMIIKGTFDIKGQVRGASAVEYYLVPIGSNIYKYIGSATKVSDTDWNLKFQSKGFPNGEFYLRAKIRNMYGEYGGGQRVIGIANDGEMVATTTTAEKVFTPFAISVEQKTAMLQAVEAELQLPKDETADTLPQSLDQRKMRIFNYCESHPDKCFPERDSDNDGLSDIDEIRYGTDTKGADSDFDGFIDGDEVQKGFDPLKYSPGDYSDRVVFESPKGAGETKENIYAVHSVELKDISLNETGSPEKRLRLMGKGLPNSFVTIYIYSDPIVLTVKTDSEGNWTYELDKELDDGEHEAYVAITDNTGKITGKSNPLLFVKTAQAVTVIPTVEAQSAETLPVTKNRAQRDILILISIIVAALSAALAVIGLVKHRHATSKEEMLS